MRIALGPLSLVLLALAIGCSGSGPARPEAAPGAGQAGTETAKRPNAGSAAGKQAEAAPAPAPKPRAEPPSPKQAAEEPAAEPRPAASTAKPKAEPARPARQGPTDEQWRAWAAALAAGRQRNGDREAAAEELERLAADGTVDFTELLHAELPEARRCAAFFLMDRVDPADPKTEHLFAAALSDSDATVRHIALTVVMRFPREALVRSLAQLAAMLKRGDEPPANRAAVARLLGRLGDAARPALPALREAALKDADRSVRSAALMAVVRVAEGSDAVALLRQVLTGDSEAALRGLAAVRLGKLGSAAAGAVDDLAGALEDADQNVRRKAADALAAIGPAAAGPLAVKLGAADVATRRYAAFALAKLGPAAAPALEALKKARHDADEEVRKLAELAIAQIERAP